ncbi:MAG: SsrA-binding protein SmpB [Candidatus Gracilibacteria bacterium]|nr:SsrA-binding protein SmpB [Candidatus Gracilibacteria bacterium]
MNKILAKNKKAFFDYEIADSWEAGIELMGHEVKSVRLGQVNLKGSYIVQINGALYVKNMHISAWKTLVNKDRLETDQPRKIFLHKKTIIMLSSKLKEAGYSIVPLEIYLSGSLIKIRVGLAKGKKAHDKKQVLKERTLEKEAKMMMKKYDY